MRNVRKLLVGCLIVLVSLTLKVPLEYFESLKASGHGGLVVDAVIRIIIFIMVLSAFFGIFKCLGIRL